MRIVQVSAYYPPHLGGQENAVRDLSQQLVKAGHEVEVLTSALGARSGSTQEDGVHVHRFGGFEFGHAPIMPQFMSALLKRATPDTLVHLHIGQAFTPELVWLAAKLRHFPFIAELHIDFEPSGPMGILLPLYKKLVLPRVLQAAQAVVTLNDQTLQLVRSAYQCSGLTRVVNNGIDEAYFQIERPRLKPTPPDVLHLLFVGRLTKQKNILALLEAMANTAHRVHLDIAGEGPELPAIRYALRQLDLHSVVLHGRLPGEEVRELYQSCDALVMPSLYEAQPLVLLEAMAARVPVICTNVVGVREHIGDGGIVVEPTASGLADGIDQFYRRYHELPQLVSKAYQRAENLRWPATVKRYEDLYAEVLAG